MVSRGGYRSEEDGFKWQTESKEGGLYIPKTRSDLNLNLLQQSSRAHATALFMFDFNLAECGTLIA